MHTHIARSSLPGASSSVTPSLISPCCSNPLATTTEDVLPTPDTTASNFRLNGASASTCLYIHMSGGPNCSHRPAGCFARGRPATWSPDLGRRTNIGERRSPNNCRHERSDIMQRQTQMRHPTLVPHMAWTSHCQPTLPGRARGWPGEGRPSSQARSRASQEANQSA